MPQSHTLLRIDGLEIEVFRKSVKHVRIAVRPPDGTIRVSAPLRTTDATLRRLLVPRLSWMRRKQAEVAAMEQPRQPEYASGELHCVRGQEYALTVHERPGSARVDLVGDKLHMYVSAGATPEQRAAVLERWLRQDLLERVAPMLETWQPRLGVRAAEVRIRRMKTRWGSCSVRPQRVWLNLELSARSDACLEYVLVHELLHLLEPSHGPRFWRLMEEHLPQWRKRRAALKGVPGALGDL